MKEGAMELQPGVFVSNESTDDWDIASLPKGAETRWHVTAPFKEIVFPVA
jgi:hypothetical protein